MDKLQYIHKMLKKRTFFAENNSKNIKIVFDIVF